MARQNRNRAFAARREPFREDADGPDHTSKAYLQLHHSSVHGPFSHLNPTRARFAVPDAPSKDQSSPPQSLASNYELLWRSRDNRKGRHPLLVHPNAATEGAKHDSNASTSAADSTEKQHDLTLPEPTTQPRQIFHIVWLMLTYYPYWDISWLVAYIFTWGSIVWCINGFFSFMPYIRPTSEFSGEVLYGGGITAFVGALLFFELGSVLLMLEAFNANNAGCFGWALEQRISEHHEGEGKHAQQQLVPSKSHCRHRQNRSTPNDQPWVWWPAWAEVRTHYLHELGFLASAAQFTGATVFSIAGITALPGIINHLSPRLTDGIYWAPQVVGGAGFIVSGTLYMLETQQRWYCPAPRLLGWNIAFWNLIGGIGFTLCGALGFASSHGAQYQAACATFWGSFAFLIGSLLQLYESLQKHPVEKMVS
jgi:hypothetical protein